jgi:hypothetical protein
VLHVTGGDTVPAAAEWAVLHRIAGAGAPVDSQRTGPDGRYVLAAARDSAAVFIVSVRYAGIAYFTEPFDDTADSLAPLAVYDTSATAPPITLRERHVIVRAAEEDGARRVIEVLVLFNGGNRTRVSGDAGEPVWSGTLPAAGAGFEIGASDVSEQAIAFEGGRIAVYAPIPPGERQIVLGYGLAASVREFVVPLDQPVARMNVLAQDSSATLSGAGLVAEGWSDLEGLRLQRWTGFDLAAGTRIVLALPAGRPSLDWAVVVVAALAAVGMTAGFAWWWRRHGSAAPGATAADPGALARQIAALDREYAGRETDEDYRLQRATLKAQLAAMLAKRKQSE